MYIYNPPEKAFSILYEDNDILIVNKESGLLTVPGRLYKDSLVTRLKSEYDYINPIHRLDTSTSGIVLLAKTKNSCSFLCEHIKRKKIVKYYIARINGLLKQSYGFINYPIERDFEKKILTNAPIQKVSYANGKECLTYFYKIKEYIDSNTSLVLLRPYSGRTHQLRVHLSAFGNSIINDHLYGLKQVSNSKELCLHACYLSFSHPTMNERINVFSSPKFVEEDIQNLFKFSKMKA